MGFFGVINPKSISCLAKVVVSLPEVMIGYANSIKLVTERPEILSYGKAVV
jgi:hypothetical protein